MRAASNSSIRKAPARITAGRAETWRDDYAARVARHRAEIRAETDRLGWSFIIHRTDRPATELLLALHERLGGRTRRRRTWQIAAHAARRNRRAPLMISGLPLAFAEPLVLLGLLSLPVLWWLLRLVPPRPRRIEFPPTRMLFDIAPKEETPARTPWWLTLLRLTLAALVIIAAAGPLVEFLRWRRRAPASRCVILIDDGFAAASTWDARMRTAEDLIARADADGRGVAVVPMSAAARDISLETAGAARARLRLVKPKPHAVERMELLPALERFLMATPDVEIVWLADGVDIGNAGDFVANLAKLADKRPVTVVEGGVKPAQALAAADNAAGVLSRQSAARRERRRGCRHGTRSRSQGTAARRGDVFVQVERPRNRSAVRPAGRNP